MTIVSTRKHGHGIRTRDTAILLKTGHGHNNAYIYMPKFCMLNFCMKCLEVLLFE